MRGLLIAAMVCVSCGSNTALPRNAGDAAVDAPGGVVGSGGGTGSGGEPEAGGVSGTGGRTVGSGGQAGTGGALDAGGDVGTGGTAGGGTGGTGGAAGSGGTTETAAGGAGRGGSTAASGGTGGLGGEGGSGGVAGATAATGGAAGASSGPKLQVLTKASACGGFVPMLLLDAGVKPDPAAPTYCDASMVRWICSSSKTGGLVVQLTRLEYQCCAELSVDLVPEGDAYRLSVSDLAQDPCYCKCVFDVQALVALPCQPTTLIWQAQTFALPIDEDGTGEVVVSKQASGVCSPLPSQSSDDIARALAGTTVTLTVTRAWVRLARYLYPQESAFVAVADYPPWTLAFSDDASSVTLGQTGGTTTYSGTRNAGNPLVYHLSPSPGGDLAIVARGSGYSAEILLYGSGSPVVLARLGELVPGS